MKTVVTTLVVLSLAGSMVGPADATRYKKKRYHSTQHGASYATRAYRHRSYDADDSLGGYYERDLSKLRFGSQRWWHVYEGQRGRR